MTRKKTIEYGGIELVIIYEYEPYDPGTYEMPPEMGTVEVIDIIHKGESIIPLFIAFEDIEEMLIDEEEAEKIKLLNRR